MEWIVGILVVVIVALIIWVGTLQSRIKNWQDRLVNSLDQELLPIRQALNLVEPWESLMSELDIDEATSKMLVQKGFTSLHNIADADPSVFIANCGIDSVKLAQEIQQRAVRITNPEKEVK